jgi:hypothetical protein
MAGTLMVKGHLGKERRYIFQDYCFLVLVQVCKLRVFIVGALQSVNEVIWQDASVGARRRLCMTVSMHLSVITTSSLEQAQNSH